MDLPEEILIKIYNYTQELNYKYVLYQLKAYFINNNLKELNKWNTTINPRREYIKYLRVNCSCHIYTFPCNKCSHIILSRIL